MFQPSPRLRSIPTHVHHSSQAQECRNVSAPASRSSQSLTMDRNGSRSLQQGDGLVSPIIRRYSDNVTKTHVSGAKPVRSGSSRHAKGCYGRNAQEHADIRLGCVPVVRSKCRALLVAWNPSPTDSHAETTPSIKGIRHWGSTIEGEALLQVSMLRGRPIATAKGRLASNQRRNNALCCTCSED